MTDLNVDVAALRAVAEAMREAALALPTTLAVDAGGCGSSAVLAAAESFNMWSMVTVQTFVGKLNGSADNADFAASQFETMEAELAAAAGT
jgi:hypothetical protein